MSEDISRLKDTMQGWHLEMNHYAAALDTAERHEGARATAFADIQRQIGVLTQSMVAYRQLSEDGKQSLTQAATLLESIHTSVSNTPLPKKNATEGFLNNLETMRNAQDTITFDTAEQDEMVRAFSGQLAEAIEETNITEINPLAVSGHYETVRGANLVADSMLEVLNRSI